MEPDPRAPSEITPAAQALDDHANIGSTAAALGYVEPIALLTAEQFRTLLQSRSFDVSSTNAVLLARIADPAHSASPGMFRPDGHAAGHTTETETAPSPSPYNHHALHGSLPHRPSRRCSTGTVPPSRFFPPSDLFGDAPLNSIHPPPSCPRPIGTQDVQPRLVTQHDLEVMAVDICKNGHDDENDDINDDHEGEDDDLYHRMRRSGRRRRRRMPHSCVRSRRLPVENDQDFREDDIYDDGYDSPTPLNPPPPRVLWVPHPTTELSSSVVRPRPCAGHAITALSSSVFVFGGFCDSRTALSRPSHFGYSGQLHPRDNFASTDGMPPVPSEDPNQPMNPHSNAVFEYKVESDEWLCLTPYMEDAFLAPRPRRHASVVVHGGSLFIYGGFDADDTVLGDLWEFKIQPKTWHRIHHFAISNHPALGNLDSTTDNVVGAGIASPDGSNDQIMSAPNQQSQQLHSSLGRIASRCLKRQVPGPRAEHTAVVYANHMIIFGGYDGKKKLNDTYIFDFVTQTWYRSTSADHNAPSRRCKHSAVLHEERMYILGGFQYHDGENYALTDLHVLDMKTYTWSPVLMGAGCPEALQGHKAVVCGDSMYVLGGKVRGTRPHQYASLDMPPLPHTTDSSSSGLNEIVYRYHLDANRWSVVEAGRNRPAPRQLHAAVAISRENKRSSIFLLGGTDKAKREYFDDLWELRGIPSVAEVNPNARCDNCWAMRSLINNSSFSDVRFRVENRLVYAHRCLLASRSEYFRTMFDAGMREAVEKEVEVPDIPYDVFLSVMDFIYTGRASIKDGRFAVNLLKAADMFGLDELRLMCVDKVGSAVNVENVAFICEIANTHNAKELKDYCIIFILQNFQKVIHTKSWADLQRRDSSGLGREILVAVSSFSLVNARCY